MIMQLVVLVCILCTMYYGHGELIMVETLTRHGERAPDKIIAQQSCTKVWTNPDDILKDYEAAPGRLTPLGVQKMRNIGKYLRKRYIDDLKFISDDYQHHQSDWIFTARAGDRQQRSMSAILLGILPNEPVAFIVSPRTEDYVLGGPAPACGETTAKMIVDWHKTKGWELLQQHMDDIVEPFEKICDVNLTGNPVNAEPGGPNPHAWLGDISDSVDAAFANDVKMPKSITPKLHKALTDLAFEIEQESHYEDPRGAIMFAGGFPNLVLDDFGLWQTKPKKAKRKSAKMKLYSCSRELMYGLQKLFGWSAQLEGQPAGRILSASTFIWELHKEDGKFFIRTLHYHPSMKKGPEQLQPDMSIEDYRAKYDAYLKEHGGPWYEICDYEHYSHALNKHDPNFVNPMYKRFQNLISVNAADDDDDGSANSVEDDVAVSEPKTENKSKSTTKEDANTSDTLLSGWGLYAVVFAAVAAGAFLLYGCTKQGSGYQAI